MIIRVYKDFVKRKNSTKQPTGGTEVHVKLKQDTSMRHPVFILSGLDSDTPKIDYLKWSNRYYFVDDITYMSNDLYALSCSIDVLATYKNVIGDYTCFVERSASMFNNMIHDPLVSGRQDIEVRRTVSTDTTTYMNNTGCYLVQTVAGVDTESTSGINTYLCRKQDIKALLNYAFDDTNPDFVNILSNEAVKAVFNPADYIISIKWLPFSDMAQFSGSSLPGPIKLGWWTTDATGYLVTHQAYGMVFTINRPQAYFPDFRNNDPNFTKLQLWLPGVGLIDVDSRYNSADLFAMYYVDCITGSATVYLKSGTAQNNHIIGSYQAMLSADIKIAQASIDMQGITSDVISAAGNLVAGNVAAGVASVIDVIPSIASPTTNSIGSQGNIAAITGYLDIYCTVTNWGSCGLATTTCGRPLMRDQQINTMSGYIKCGNASCPISGCDADRNEVNSFLNGGFYYE